MKLELDNGAFIRTIACAVEGITGWVEISALTEQTPVRLHTPVMIYDLFDWKKEGTRYIFKIQKVFPAPPTEGCRGCQ